MESIGYSVVCFYIHILPSGDTSDTFVSFMISSFIVGTRTGCKSIMFWLVCGDIDL